MKLIKKTIIAVIILVVIFYIALNIFISGKGRELLASNLTQIIGREVTLGSMGIMPPYSILINDLEIEDFLDIDKIKVEPSIIGLFFGKVGLNKLVISGAEASIVRIGEQELNISPIIDNAMQIEAKAGQARTAVSAPGDKSRNVEFFIKDVILRDAKVLFKDKIAGLSLGISSARAYVHTNPLTFKTTVSLNADVVSAGDAYLGKISMDGWLNIPRKDMAAEFKIEDLEAAYFYPYLSKFFSKIESGKFLFSADMASKSNDLAINCHLEAQDLKFSIEPLSIDINGKKITLGDNLSGFILDSIIGPGGGGVFDFTIRTKFDRPKLEGLQFKGNIFRNSVGNVIRKLPQENIEAIKEIGKDFKNIGKEFKEQFKDIGDVFKGFKKKAEETEEETAGE